MAHVGSVRVTSAGGVGDRGALGSPSSLPAPLTSFVGRSRELTELRDLVARSRLVTLTGAGGCGKTRLALRASAEATSRCPDGVWWVELAAVADDALVDAALSEAVGAQPLPGQTDVDALVAYLAPRRALLVLDNCEHVIDRAARVAETLARSCPHLRVLATSREPLRAEGETEWRVPSLSLPDPGADLDAFVDADAVRLFIERAAQVRPGFRVTAENASAVATICRELAGVPLAIELAAARLRSMSLDQIADGLGDRLRLLAGGVRTARPRQQTMRASVEWSHDLLSEHERMLLRRLAVFAGGFTVDAAERVCAAGDLDAGRVMDVLVALVEKSLVLVDERGRAVRYRMLETVRQYAAERLEGAGEAKDLRDRHLDHFLDVAEHIAPGLLTPRQPEFLDALDPDAANFATAIDHAAAEDPEKALRLAVALTFWWRLRSLFAQGEAALVRVLDAAPEPSVVRARALWARASLLTRAGRWDEALPASLLALEAAERQGDDSTAARCLWAIGLAQNWPDPIGARATYERALELAAASGDDFARMHALQSIGGTYLFQEDHRPVMPWLDEAFVLAERLGQYDALSRHWTAIAFAAWIAGDFPRVAGARDRAIELAQQVGDVMNEITATGILAFVGLETGQPRRLLEVTASLRERTRAAAAPLVVPAIELTVAVARAADGQLDEARPVLERLIAQGANGWAWVLVAAFRALAEVRRLQGDAPGARAAAEQAIDLGARIGNRPAAAEAHLVLGQLAAARGEWTEAQRLLHDALAVAAEYGNPRVPRVLDALAAVAAGLESHTEAARILGAAARRRGELGIVVWPAQRAETEAVAARVREALGDEAFAAAHAEGYALTAEEAIAYVRRARGERKRPSAGWESLTPTEAEVVRHVAAGLTNPEIAARMFVSRGTVRTHLSHIFAKLGVSNRAELAAAFSRREPAADI